MNKCSLKVPYSSKEKGTEREKRPKKVLLGQLGADDGKNPCDIEILLWKYLKNSDYISSKSI